MRTFMIIMLHDTEKVKRLVFLHRGNRDRTDKKCNIL